MKDTIRNLHDLAEKYFESGQRNGWSKKTMDNWHTAMNQLIKIVYDKHEQFLLIDSSLTDSRGKREIEGINIFEKKSIISR